MKIKELNEYDKPYEKCEKYGINALTDKELLGIVIRSGTKNVSALDIAEKILFYKSNLSNINNLNKMQYLDLISIEGIGKVKAIQILAISELFKRMSISRYPKKIYFNSASSIANYYMEELRHLDHEELRLLCLDIKGALLNSSVLFKGSISACTISSREIFLQAIKSEAARIIILHNHPSGDPTPSKADIDVTNSINKVAMELGIYLLDHIIIGDLKYYSLKENKDF